MHQPPLMALSTDVCAFVLIRHVFGTLLELCADVWCSLGLCAVVYRVTRLWMPMGASPSLDCLDRPVFPLTKIRESNRNDKHCVQHAQPTHSHKRRRKEVVYCGKEEYKDESKHNKKNI